MKGAGGSEFKKTIVAFANSLPANRTGVLFVGITDTGQAVGVGNSDRLQKTIRRLAKTNVTRLCCSFGVTQHAELQHDVLTDTRPDEVPRRRAPEVVRDPA